MKKTILATAVAALLVTVFAAAMVVADDKPATATKAKHDCAEVCKQVGKDSKCDHEACKVACAAHAKACDAKDAAACAEKCKTACEAHAKSAAAKAEVKACAESCKSKCEGAKKAAAEKPAKAEKAAASSTAASKKGC